MYVDLLSFLVICDVCVFWSPVTLDDMHHAWKMCNSTTPLAKAITHGNKYNHQSYSWMDGVKKS